MNIDCLQLFLELGRTPLIVTIEEGQPRISGETDPMVAGRTDSGSLLIHISYSAITKTVEDRIGSVV